MTGFLDTNILVYAFGDDDRRRAPAQALIYKGNMVGVQVLNEFASVALRKLRRSWDEIDAAVAIAVDSLLAVQPITLALHRSASALCRRYRFGIYDGLIVAAALEGGCDTLYSEDMHAGLVVDGRLTIVNPFA